MPRPSASSAALQLRNVPDRHVEMVGEHSLTYMRPLTHRANIIRGDVCFRKRVLPEMAHSIFWYAASGIRPVLRIPFAVSNSAFVSLLGFFALALIATHLRQSAFLNLSPQLDCARIEPVRRDFLQRLQLVIVDVVQLALCEPVEKHRALASAVRDQHDSLRVSRARRATRCLMTPLAKWRQSAVLGTLTASHKLASAMRSFRAKRLNTFVTNTRTFTSKHCEL